MFKRLFLSKLLYLMYCVTTNSVHSFIVRNNWNPIYNTEKTCPLETYRCPYPLRYEETAHFACNIYHGCPQGLSCCEDSCFQHRICKLNAEPDPSYKCCSGNCFYPHDPATKSSTQTTSTVSSSKDFSTPTITESLSTSGSTTVSTRTKADDEDVGSNTRVSLSTGGSTTVSKITEEDDRDEGSTMLEDLFKTPPIYTLTPTSPSSPSTPFSTPDSTHYDSGDNDKDDYDEGDNDKDDYDEGDNDKDDYDKDDYDKDDYDKDDYDEGDNDKDDYDEGNTTVPAE